jgi:hypothetical protein
MDHLGEQSCPKWLNREFLLLLSEQHRNQIRAPMRGLAAGYGQAYSQPGDIGDWPAPGSEDTELGVLMELEGGHGETEVYPRVQA